MRGRTADSKEARRDDLLAGEELGGSVGRWLVGWLRGSVFERVGLWELKEACQTKISAWIGCAVVWIAMTVWHCKTR
jgi:hypothetical protein